MQLSAHNNVLGNLLCSENYTALKSNKALLLKLVEIHKILSIVLAVALIYQVEATEKQGSRLVILGASYFDIRFEHFTRLVAILL